MVELERLRVSLTKNGYMKIAEVLKRHPRWEVLDNLRGVYPGINIVRSQAANIMDESVTGDVPEYWDEIRSHSDDAIEAFVFIAVVMSHAELIEALKSSSRGDMKGYLRRDEFATPKVYMNLQYAMASVGACDYQRGSTAISYDLRTVVYHLRAAGNIVKSLISSKLRRCGWRDRATMPVGTDFWAECEAAEIHRVFGLESQQFRRWMRNQLQVDSPITPETVRIGVPK